MFKRKRLDVGADGKVRGWHRECPAADPGMLGTYALIPGPKGRVDCEACGMTDLVRCKRERQVAE